MGLGWNQLRLWLVGRQIKWGLGLDSGLSLTLEEPQRPLHLRLLLHQTQVQSRWRRWPVVQIIEPAFNQGGKWKEENMAKIEEVGKKLGKCKGEKMAKTEKAGFRVVARFRCRFEEV